MTLIPAFRAAGIAFSRRALAARFPAPVGERPREVERKKFCMSIMTSADRVGFRRIGVVVVGRWRHVDGEGMGYEGGEGRVRSKVGGEGDQSQ